jgi:hypothetical protein
MFPEVAVCGDFIAFAVNAALPDNQARRMGVSGKNMQGFFMSAFLPRAAHGLAVNGDDTLNGSNQAIDLRNRLQRLGCPEDRRRARMFLPKHRRKTSSFSSQNRAISSQSSAPHIVSIKAPSRFSTADTSQILRIAGLRLRQSAQESWLSSAGSSFRLRLMSSLTSR